MKKLNEKLITKPWVVYALVLVTLIIVYQITYLLYPAVPGNNPEYPLGWWGWVDQGRYLTSSLAFSTGDFSEIKHFYVPSYPFLGSLLLGITAQHSYWLPDLLLLLGYAALFIAFVSRYVGIWQAAFALLIGTMLFTSLRLQWVIPWTSTLAAFLMMAVLSLLDRYLRKRINEDWSAPAQSLNAYLFGAAAGALVATRPVDLVVMLPAVLTYSFFILKDTWIGGSRRTSAFLSIFTGLVGALLPVIGWLYFNRVVYGAFFGGPYFRTADTAGFFPSTLDTKFYSQILDSFTLYGKVGQDWLSQLPLFALSLAFVPSLFIARVPLVFRVMVFTFVLQFGLYYSFSDIVPTGTFLFYNIHYFKWMMPLLLVSVLLVAQAFYPRKKDKHKRGHFALIMAAFVILAASVTTMTQHYFSIDVLHQDKKRAVFSLPKKYINYIDIPVKSNDWTSIYFAKGFSVALDNNTLRMPRDFHAYPIKGGMRLLFVRPISGKQLILDLGTDVQFTKPLDDLVQGANVSFRAGLRSANHNHMFVLPLRLGEQLSFKADGNVDGYLEHGWSDGEDWGRWIDGERAEIRLRLAESGQKDLVLHFTAMGFVIHSKQPYVETKVMVNGCLINQLRFEDGSPHTFDVGIPANCIGPDNFLKLSFQNINYISPKSAGLNMDTRKLGMGMISMYLSN